MTTTTEPTALPELTTTTFRVLAHLILPEWHGRPAEIEGRARALCGYRRTGSPLLLPDRGGRGNAGLVTLTWWTRAICSARYHYDPRHWAQEAGLGREKLKALNPAINIVKHETMLTSANAMEILKDYDIVADGTDNFPSATWSTTPACCWASRIVYGSIFRF